MLGPNGGHFQWLFRRPVVRTTKIEYSVATPVVTAEDAKAIEAEIKKLQEKLAAINNKRLPLNKSSRTTKKIHTFSTSRFSAQSREK